MKRAWLFLLLWLAATGASIAAPGSVDLLAFGDWGYGSGSSRQRQVAEQLEKYTRKSRASFDAVLLLGDNFYRELSKGARDERWRTLFEEMYDPMVFPIPFYAALGNHDYKYKNKAAQLTYARENPESRFKLPAKWYVVDIPSHQPLVTVLVLDSNWSRLTAEERQEQNRWLEQQLANHRPAPWTIAMAHHPLFSNGKHGDSPVLIEDWGRLFRRHKVDFYLAGHDHNLQHLELEGWPISFVIAGGGGAKLQGVRRNDRGPFSRVLHGFVHLAFTPERVSLRYISIDGDLVHEFTRYRDGRVSVLKSTGRDKPDPREKGKDDDDDDDDD